MDFENYDMRLVLCELCCVEVIHIIHVSFVESCEPVKTKSVTKKKEKKIQFLLLC